MRTKTRVKAGNVNPNYIRPRDWAYTKVPIE